MMNVNTLAASHKANLDQLFGLSSQAFAGVEQLVNLNLNAARAALEEAASHAQALVQAKDPQAALALQTSLAQALPEKAMAYGRDVYEIATSTSAHLTQSLEGQAAQGQQAVQDYLDAALKNAPAGSEQAVVLVKQAINASNTALASAQKAIKQAADLAESQLQSVGASVTQASKTAAKSAAKKR